MIFWYPVTCERHDTFSGSELRGTAIENINNIKNSILSWFLILFQNNICIYISKWPIEAKPNSISLLHKRNASNIKIAFVPNELTISLME